MSRHRCEAKAFKAPLKDRKVKNISGPRMDFLQVQAAVREFFADAERAEEALQRLLPELSVRYGCANDAEAWGLLGNVAPKVISEMSGLDIPTSQWLKERAKQQQKTMLTASEVPVEVVPTDVAERLRYMLAKEGFEVRGETLRVRAADLRLSQLTRFSVCQRFGVRGLWASFAVPQQQAAS